MLSPPPPPRDQTNPFAYSCSLTFHTSYKNGMIGHGGGGGGGTLSKCSKTLNVGQNIPGQNIPCHFLTPRTKHPTSIYHPGQNIPCSFCHSRTKHPMPFLPPRTKHPMAFLPPRTKHPTLCLRPMKMHKTSNLFS